MLTRTPSPPHRLQREAAAAQAKAAAVGEDDTVAALRRENAELRQALFVAGAAVAALALLYTRLRRA